MPSRKRKRNRALDFTSDFTSTSARSTSASSDYTVWDFVLFWVSAHFWLARKCSNKICKLLIQLQDCDRKTSEMLYSQWTPLTPAFALASYMVTFVIFYVIVKVIPVLYIVFADVIFMCIFWISEIKNEFM